MEDVIKDALIKDLQAGTISCRGHVMQRCVELEMLIDIYIGKYFTNERKKLEELVTLIIAPRMTFDSKIQVLKVLIDDNESGFKTKYPNFNKHLKEIIENRNIFAHYPVDLSNYALSHYKKDKTITLLKFKNVKDQITNKNKLINRVQFTNKEITVLIDKIYDYINIFTDLL